MIFKTDCKFWRGDKPCQENRLCEGCQAYQKLGPRILIIKLGARGDVLRTTPLVAGLRKKYPGAHLTWVTGPDSLELLQELPGLDKVLPASWQAAVEIQARRFDLVVCLDKEPWATGLAEMARSDCKQGWGLAEDGVGTPRAFSPEAEYSLALGVSDDLKFRKNQKTYLQIIFEAMGLSYGGEKYAFQLKEQDRARQKDFFRENALTPGNVVGLVIGCGPAFLRKRWTETGFAKLAEWLQDHLKAQVVLLSGPGEEAISREIQRQARKPLLDTQGQHNLREFAAFLEACRVVVTGDTLALHLAIALERPVVALFGPTCSQEIDLLGLGEKIISNLDCSPCYRRTCGEKPTCMEALDAAAIQTAVERLWGKNHEKA